MTRPSRGRQTITEIFLVAQDPTVTPNEFRLWVLIRSHENKDPSKGAWPSDIRLAQEMGKGERTVQTARAGLLEKGYLRQRLMGPDAAHYWAILPPRVSQESAKQESQDSARQEDVVSQDVSQEGSQNSAPILRNNYGTTTTTPPNPPAGEGDWKSFRETYPEREGEQRWTRAEQQWQEHIRSGVSTSEMLAGAMRYREWSLAAGKFGGLYVKLASNWLAERLWKEPYTITESMTAKESGRAKVDDGPPQMAGPWTPVPSDRELAALAACPDSSDQGSKAQ